MIKWKNVSNVLKVTNLFLTNQTTWTCQCFFRMSQNTMLPFIQICTSYIIWKCKSVKMINIPWFLVSHFYLLSVQSYKHLKLRAFKEWLFRKTTGRKILAVGLNTSSNTLMFILREQKYSIPCKIRPVQEKIEIVLIFKFSILILNIDSNSVQISEK